MILSSRHFQICAFRSLYCICKTIPGHFGIFLTLKHLIYWHCLVYLDLQNFGISSLDTDWGYIHMYLDLFENAGFHLSVFKSISTQTKSSSNFLNILALYWMIVPHEDIVHTWDNIWLKPNKIKQNIHIHVNAILGH